MRATPLIVGGMEFGAFVNRLGLMHHGSARGCPIDEATFEATRTPPTAAVMLIRDGVAEPAPLPADLLHLSRIAPCTSCAPMRGVQ